NPKTPLPSSEAPESASPHPLGQPGWAYEIRYGQVATEYKFDELGAKLIAEPGEAELINGDKLRFAEETYRPLTIGEKAVERAERVLEQKGILKPGQKLMPYLVEDSAGNLVEAKGGTRRVYRHPTDPNKVIKVYDPEMQPGYRSRPDKIVKLMQRERAFEGYLQRFRKYGLEVVENDYSLAEYGVVIQEEVQGGVKVDEYLTRLTAGGKNAEAASFGHRLDGIRKEIEALRDDMDKLMRERYDFHFHKGGETGEKVPIDFGETKGTRRLNNCRVVDASPEPRIRCFDW
ncbi:MAG: hypothetical protein HY075_01865, partial [Deltaproteobacteria bacterium]|nr:hypothetical protein [Deltaproteobacteria bacterium]